MRKFSYILCIIYIISKENKVCMNNTVENMKNNLFEFPKVKWLEYTGEVGNVQAIDVIFSQNSTHQKSLKIV